MANDTTTNGASTTTAEPITIDAQLDQLIEEVESMKVTTQDHLTGLKSLGTKLKSIQREHKSSSKELHTIRQTICSSHRRRWLTAAVDLCRKLGHESLCAC